jgi:SAM-dependent methyltransferase
MPNLASGFVGDIPTHYDQGLGPTIFAAYADRLVDRCCSETATRTIELAAGTGIVSQRLRDRLPAETKLLVTDLNAPMLEVAKAKFPDDANVDFAIADAMNLQFEDASFDLMVCQFGVMFFPDKPAAFREAARVLKPGGRYIFNVWSDMSENPYSLVAHDVGARFFPDDPPGFYKLPFNYGDPDVVSADLAAGGWTDIEHETIRLNQRIVDPEAFATALVYGNPLIDEIRVRGGVKAEDVAADMVAAIDEAFRPTDFTMPLSTTTFACRVS